MSHQAVPRNRHWLRVYRPAKDGIDERLWHWQPQLNVPLGSVFLASFQQGAANSRPLSLWARFYSDEGREAKLLLGFLQRPGLVLLAVAIRVTQRQMDSVLQGWCIRIGPFDR
jgi:hypothetical protein